MWPSYTSWNVKAFSSLFKSCCVLVSRKSHSSPDLYLSDHCHKRDGGPLIVLLCIPGRVENQTWTL